MNTYHLAQQNKLRRQDQQWQQQQLQQQQLQQQQLQQQQLQQQQLQQQQLQRPSDWAVFGDDSSELIPVNQSAVCPEKAVSLHCNFYFIDRILACSQKRDYNNKCALNTAQPFTPNVFGLNWFSRCSGDLSFWSSDSQRRSELFTPEHKHNILYSLDWRDSRPEALAENNGNNNNEMVALICNYSLRWKPAENNNRRTGNREGDSSTRGQHASFAVRRDPLRGYENVRYIKNGDTTRIYAVIKTWSQLARLYSELGLADRHMEELLLQNTPQKFYVDVERDLSSQHVITRAESRAELENITRVFEEKFISYLLEFVQDVLHVHTARQSDFVVSYSSQPGAKFSARVILSTPKGPYFDGCIISHTAAALMAMFMHEKAQVDPKFKDWYVIDDRKTMVDYSAYDCSQRMMRMIGCCKINSKFQEGLSWKSARVFVPAENVENRPLKDFVISFYDALKHPGRYQQISLTQDQLQEAAQFASRGIWHRLIRKRNIIARVSNLNLQTQINQSNQQQSMLQQQQQQQQQQPEQTVVANDPELIVDDIIGTALADPGSASEVPLQALMGLMSEDSRGICERLAANIRDVPAFWEDYYSVGLLVLKHLLEGIHPFCNPKIDCSFVHTAPTPWLFKARLTPYIQGISRTDNDGFLRFCYLGCNQCNHQVVIYMFNDFSIGYYCHGRGCEGKRIIFKSPIQQDSNQVRPGVAPLRDFAPEIAPHVIEYDDRFQRKLLLPEEIDDLPLDNSQPITDVKMTYALHASLGTGKTTAVKDLLNRLRTRRTEPRILSISFRVMLARKASQRLGLSFYKDQQSHNLAGVRELALQIDSLERLLEVTDDEEITSKLVCGHDVVFCDEICSLLSHLNSDTLKTKLSDIWNIFFQIIKRAKILIVSDADLGPREQRFLRMTRGQMSPSMDQVEIPNLYYHYNRRVPIRTKFIEYAGEWEWANELLRCAIIENFNCLVVSNSINQIERLKSWLHMRLTEIMDRYRRCLQEENGFVTAQVDASPYVRRIEELYGAIHTITSKSTNTEKARMEHSNKAWKEAKVLLISPTVGAGVDFLQEHFHVSFCYATNKSCCTRAINQMRDRVRRIESGICHVYISASTDKTEELPVTPAAALVDLVMYRRAYLLGSAQEGMAQQDTVSFSRSLIDKHLLEIQAYNAAENHRSFGNLRMEWVKLQQARDPYVKYLFDDKCVVRNNIDFRVLMTEIQSKERKRCVTQISTRGVMNKRAYQHTLQKLQMDKRMKVEESQVGALVDDNTIRRFFAIKPGVEPKVFKELIAQLNVNKMSDFAKIDDTIRILFLGMQDLAQLAQDSHLITATVINASHSNSEVLSYNDLGQRMIEETMPTDFEKQHWVKILLYACGADFQMIETDFFSAFKLHIALSAQRLFKDRALQRWLKDVVARRLKAFSIPQKKNTLPPIGIGGEFTDFTWKNVYVILKMFFETHFDINFVSERTSRRSRNRGEEQQENGQQQQGHTCEEEGDPGKCIARHTFRYLDAEKRKEVTVYCRCASVGHDDLCFMVEKMYARVFVEGATDLKLQDRQLETVRAKLTAIRNQIKHPSEFMNMLLSKEEQLKQHQEEPMYQPQQANDADDHTIADGNTVADDYTIADGNTVADDHTIADGNTIADDHTIADGNTIADIDSESDGDEEGGGYDDYIFGDYAYGVDLNNEEDEEQHNDATATLLEERGQTEGGNDNSSSVGGNALSDDRSRTLMSIHSTHILKHRRKGQVAFSRAKTFVEERQKLWGAVKAPFLPINPTELDPIGFHDQIISPHCKRIMETEINKMIEFRKREIDNLFRRGDVHNPA